MNYGIIDSPWRHFGQDIFDTFSAEVYGDKKRQANASSTKTDRIYIHYKLAARWAVCWSNIFDVNCTKSGPLVKKAFVGVTTQTILGKHSFWFGMSHTGVGLYPETRCLTPRNPALCRIHSVSNWSYIGIRSAEKFLTHNISKSDKMYYQRANNARNFPEHTPTKQIPHQYALLPQSVGIHAKSISIHRHDTEAILKKKHEVILCMSFGCYHAYWMTVRDF